MLARNPRERPTALEVARALGVNGASFDTGPTARLRPRAETALTLAAPTRAAGTGPTLARRAKPYRAVRRGRVVAATLALAVLLALSGGGVYALASKEPPGIAAPALVGKTLPQGRALVGRRADEEGVAPPRVLVTSRAYSERVPAGAILAQSDPPGEHVPATGTLGVRLSLGTPWAVVPSTVGRETRTAVDAARGLGVYARTPLRPVALDGRVARREDRSPGGGTGPTARASRRPRLDRAAACCGTRRPSATTARTASTRSRPRASRHGRGGSVDVGRSRHDPRARPAAGHTHADGSDRERHRRARAALGGVMTAVDGDGRSRDRRDRRRAVADRVVLAVETGRSSASSRAYVDVSWDGDARGERRGRLGARTPCSSSRPTRRVGSRSRSAPTGRRTGRCGSRSSARSAIVRPPLRARAPATGSASRRSRPRTRKIETRTPTNAIAAPAQNALTNPSVRAAGTADPLRDAGRRSSRRRSSTGARSRARRRSAARC